MSLNTNECQEHTHEIFNNPVTISCDAEDGLRVINTNPDNQLNRIVLGKNNYPYPPGCGIGYSRYNENDAGYLYMKMFGLNHAEFKIYENNIIINNLPSPMDKSIGLYQFDLCKWIVDVNKKLFNKDNLYTNSHDYVYKPSVQTQTEQ